MKALVKSLAVAAVGLGLLGGCDDAKGRDAPRAAPASTTKWVDPAELRPGPVRHEQLTAAQVERITKLHETFKDADPTPLSKWLEDFKRDRDPDREIAICEGMAKAYSAYCEGRELSPSAKRDVYRVVLLRSAAPENEVMKRVKLDVLKRADVEEILAL